MRVHRTLSDDLVFLPSRRRTYSLDYDTDDYTPAGSFPVSRKAIRVSTNAMDDSELLSAASSRKDRNLMHDITSKMAALQFSRPIPTEAARRPYMTVGSSARVRSVSPRTPLRYISPYVVSRSRLMTSPRTSLPPSAALRYARAMSVPPRSFVGTCVIDDEDYDDEYYSMRARRRDAERRRRDVRASSEPPVMNAGVEFAIRQARNRLTRLEPISASSVGYRSSSLSRVGSRPVIAPSGVDRRARIAALEARYDCSRDEYDLPRTSLSSLRSQTNEVRNRMDTHRDLLDRYLPINFGPEAEVQDAILYKYSELVDRPIAADAEYVPLRAHRIGQKCRRLGNEYANCYAVRRVTPITSTIRRLTAAY